VRPLTGLTVAVERAVDMLRQPPRQTPSHSLPTLSSFTESVAFGFEDNPIVVELYFRSRPLYRGLRSGLDVTWLEVVTANFARHSGRPRFRAPPQNCIGGIGCCRESADAVIVMVECFISTLAALQDMAKAVLAIADPAQGGEGGAFAYD